MSETAIQAQKLCKHYGATRAIDQLDLAVPTGSIFGLLGVNGAGKTSFIRMAVGHLHPTAGQLSVLDSEPRRTSEATRQRIAYVSENMGLPGHMTPEKAIAFNAALYPEWDAPLADKLLVSAALLALVYLNCIETWVAAVIILREIFITGFRFYVLVKDSLFTTSWLAKKKTVFQILAISVLILCKKPYHGALYITGTILLYVAVLLTVYSGIEYLMKYSRSVKE